MNLARSESARVRLTRAALIVAVLGACNSDGLSPPFDGPPGDAAIAFPESDMAASCTDGLQDQDETGVDCGGAICFECDSGMRCLADTDCQSRLCLAGNCAAGPTCDDQRKDGTETDVDCGGAACPACALAGACVRDADCATGVCLTGKCGPKLTLSFAKPALTSTPVQWGVSIASGDFDGDRKADLVLGAESGVLVPLYGKGDGTFVVGAATDPAGATRTLAVADFDRDGRDDVAGSDGSRALLYLAAPGRALHVPSTVAQSGAQALLAGDWNGDKDPDLVIGTNNAFSVLQGNGKGGFPKTVTGAVGGGDLGSLFGFAAGDLDGNGESDLLASFEFAFIATRKLPVNGFWTVAFDEGAAVRKNSTATYSTCALGDFDHDGATDLLVYVSWPSLYVFRGDHKGGFLPYVESANPPGGYHGLLVSDLNTCALSTCPRGAS